MDLETARVNMIKQQLRTCDVLDGEILQLLQETARENFVPEQYRELAYADFNIPIGHGQVMMTPVEEGQILQALKIKSTDKILEIGTGSAYLTALLAQLGSQVISIDCFPEFVEPAKEKLHQIGLNNVTMVCSDGSNGWQSQAPFDVIVITASVVSLPDSFRQQLDSGGRIFVILGTAPVMEATLISQGVQGQFQTEKLFETELTTMICEGEKTPFIF
ncbi:MAG: protein-L-isoaspartate O-methyltransferase [Gammaproteobacteria bacterium]